MGTRLQDEAGAYFVVFNLPWKLLATPDMAEAEQELWADVQPEFAAIHEMRSDLPVECITICMPSFAGNHWAMVLADPGDWAGTAPATPTPVPMP